RASAGGGRRARPRPPEPRRARARGRRRRRSATPVTDTSSSGREPSRWGEANARPELQVERATQLHPRLELAAAVALEPPPGGGRVDEPALGEGARREEVGRELAEPAAQPTLLGRHEAELVAALPHDRGEQVAEGPPQHRLRPSAADELAPGQREAELHQPV